MGKFYDAPLKSQNLPELTKITKVLGMGNCPSHSLSTIFTIYFVKIQDGCMLEHLKNIGLILDDLPVSIRDLVFFCCLNILPCPKRNSRSPYFSMSQHVCLCFF